MSASKKGTTSAASAAARKLAKKLEAEKLAAFQAEMAEEAAKDAAIPHCSVMTLQAITAYADGHNKAKGKLQHAAEMLYADKIRPELTAAPKDGADRSFYSTLIAACYAALSAEEQRLLKCADTTGMTVEQAKVRRQAMSNGTSILSKIRAKLAELWAAADKQAAFDAEKAKKAEQGEAYVAPAPDPSQTTAAINSAKIWKRVNDTIAALQKMKEFDGNLTELVNVLHSSLQYITITKPAE